MSNSQQQKTYVWILHKCLAIFMFLHYTKNFVIRMKIWHCSVQHIFDVISAVYHL